MLQLSPVYSNNRFPLTTAFRPCRLMMNRQNLSVCSVLVVDDSQAVRLLIQKILKELGVRIVFLAENGEAALKQLTDRLPDLVITDYQMEPMNGMQFVNALRRSPIKRINKMPIIMLTGHSEREVVQKAVNAGVSDFVVKPIEPKKLCERVLHVLAKMESD